MSLGLKLDSDAIMNLSQLQNLIKRDPSAYQDEFLLQLKHFDSEMEIFNLKPSRDSERFKALVSFLCHTVPSYKNCEENIQSILPISHKSTVPLKLINLLRESASILHPDVRFKMFQGLVILRNRDIIEPLTLIDLSFKLFTVPDKSLRQSLTQHIINDVKNLNSNKKNEHVNKSIKALLFSIVTVERSFSGDNSVPFSIS